MSKGWRVAVVVLVVAAVVVAVTVKARKGGGGGPPTTKDLAAVSGTGAGREARVGEVRPGASEPASSADGPADTAVEREPRSASGDDEPTSAEDEVKAALRPPGPDKPSGGTESSGAAKPVSQKPKMLPRLVDLGADKCIPCKMMAPILEGLAKDYKGKLTVEVIDVWKDRKAAEKYKIKSIPTQVFYDQDGKEFSRHIGFFSKEDILATFEKQGIKL